jgi:hypothetical protein
MFGHWLEYNEEAVTDATRRMREFLKRHLNWGCANIDFSSGSDSVAAGGSEEPRVG